MKSKILTTFLLIFCTIQVSALFTDDWSAAQKAERLSSCKSLKEQGLFRELTSEDQLICNELISADLIANPPQKKKVLSNDNQIQRHKQAVVQYQVPPKKMPPTTDILGNKFPIEEVTKQIVEYAVKEDASPEDIQAYVLAAGYTIDDVNAYVSATKKKKADKEKWDKITGIAGPIFALLIFLFVVWLFFFKIIPHLIYVIRKAWLKAAQDAKQK